MTSHFLSNDAAALRKEFMSRAEPNSISECWPWKAGLMGGTGYGCFRGAGAHRWAHELFKGPIAPGLTVDHRCFNRACVNLDHLDAVTQDENNQRYFDSVTHCDAGHEYTPENIYWVKRDAKPAYRQCRTCRRVASLKNRRSEHGSAYIRAYRRSPEAMARHRERERQRRLRASRLP